MVFRGNQGNLGPVELVVARASFGFAIAYIVVYLFYIAFGGTYR